jgi:CheY-like chemotaxis protein
MLLPKPSGPDVLKALKLDPATTAIPVVVMSGLSQKNAARLEKDGAFALPGKIRTRPGSRPRTFVGEA